MRKIILSISIISLSFIISACTAGSDPADKSLSITETPDKFKDIDMSFRPSDFKLDYDWSNGSLPPPYHSSYDITIGPGELGLIEYMPDYASDETPLWIEQFPITDNDLDQIYAYMYDNGILSTNWESEEGDLAAGGSTQRLMYITHGYQYTIPRELRTENHLEIRELYKTIKSLVPEEIWAKLELQELEYQKENED